jgi:protein ImuB
MGRAHEALTPRRPPPLLYSMRILAEPILTLDAVLTVIADMGEELCATLDQAGHGARRLQLVLFGVDAKIRSVKIAMGRPEQNPKVMLRLFRERLSATPENLNAEFGFETARLEAIDTAPIQFHATDLAPASKRDRDSEIRALDTIAARLGVAAVARVQANDLHAPQRATRFCKTEAKATPTPPPPADNVMRRPLCLFAQGQPIEAVATVPDGPPLRFRWRRILHEIVRAEGPERIAPDWLRYETQTRDYYRVEDKNGQRFWLYREGIYGQDGLPRWFIQGAFA